MKSIIQKGIKVFVLLLGGFFLFFLILLLSVYLGFFGSLPHSAEIARIENMQASVILDNKGEVLDKIYVQDRSSVPFDEISPFIIHTLVAVEDRRFYDHGGIDYYSLLRVAIKSVLLGNESAGGGSTLTQQLAKNLYPRKDFGWLYYPVNKLREMIIAQRIEHAYSKEEILALYLNTVSFGLDIFGVETASQRFFSKSAKEINQQEAATLVGMLKATTYYNPVIHPERSKKRRDFVLRYLQENRFIRTGWADSLVQTEFIVKEQKDRDRRFGYIKYEVSKRANGILQNLYPDSTFDLSTQGLRIYTTIDLDKQLAAEKAVVSQLMSLQKNLDKQLNPTFWDKNKDLVEKELQNISYQPQDSTEEILVYSHSGPVKRSLTTRDSIQYYLSFLRASMISVSPQSGEIQTWVGGVDYDYFPYDHVRSKRQVGSTIKPFVYAAALEKGVDPCEYFETSSVSYEVKGENWTPKNSNKELEEQITMQRALEQSVNTVAVKILQQAGINQVVEILKASGVTADIPAVPSLALGTPSISLYEMVQAYAVFINDGIYKPQYLISHIEDSQGKILYKYMPDPDLETRVISKKTAEIIRYFLINAVNEGTGSALKSQYGLAFPIGGKTGTTQKGSDGWFIGITPNEVMGAWVGGAYPDIRFQYGSYAQGARMALPIIGKYDQHLRNSANYRLLRRARFSPISSASLEAMNCDPFKKEFKWFEWLFGKRKPSQNEETIIIWSSSDSVQVDNSKTLIESIKGLFKRKKKKKTGGTPDQ